MLPLRELLHAVIVLFVSVALVGCTFRAGDFTVGSTKNIGLLAQKGDPVEGEDCSAQFLFIPVAGPTHPNMKTALDKALEKSKSEVLIEAVITEMYLNLLIFSQHCFTIQGKGARGEFGKK